MASCSVEVMLDRRGQAPHWTPAYLPTDAVTGEVVVVVDDAVQCRGLDLDLIYVRTDHDFRVEVPESARTDLRYTPLEPVTVGAEPLRRTLQKYAVPLFTVPMLGLGVGALIHAAFGIEESAAVFVVCAATAEALLLLSFWRARKRAGIASPKLEVMVSEGLADYRVRAPETPQPKLLARATVGPGGAVDYASMELVVRETTTVRERGHEGQTVHRPVHTTLLRETQRLEARGDDVYDCEIPLPPPLSQPYSTGCDEHGRGVVWEVIAEVHRLTPAPPERSICPIDVRPAIAPPLQR